MTRRSDKKSRGYFGIGIERPKTEMNIGTMWRSAFCFDAAFMYTIGRRAPKQAGDTTCAWRHVPMHEYSTVADWHAHVPFDCVPVGVEIVDGAQPLEDFVHPERAVYLLGPEDGGLSREAQLACVSIVQIDTRFCLNVASAATVLMYDRNAKRGRGAQSGEHHPVTVEVAGSKPVAVAHGSVAQTVERASEKREVGDSSAPRATNRGTDLAEQGFDPSGAT